MRGGPKTSKFGDKFRTVSKLDREYGGIRDGHGSGRPWVELGRVRILCKFVGSGQVGSKYLKMHYVNFAVFVVCLVKIVMKKCYISTLPTISHSR